LDTASEEKHVARA